MWMLTLRTKPVVLLLFSLLTFSSVYGQISHVILGPFLEQQRAGVMVGNVASASNIASQVSPEEFQTLRYEFLDPSNLQTASLFTLNGQTGGVFTSAMIDREAVCEYQEECLLKFDVSVNSDSTAFLRIVSVAVNITDVNDNVPTFPRDEITLNIPEGNNIGVTYPLPNAVDKDTKKNAVMGYNILTTTKDFDLNVEKNLDNTFKVSMNVNTVLDREQRDRYLVRVTAHDGGLRPLTGTLNVNINVTDVNDNAPEFSQRSYSYSVVENAPVGTVIGRVFATDMDTGVNARITYSFSASSSRSRVQELFAIDPNTGEIQIIAPLQFVSGNTFDAVITAKDNGFPAQETQAQLQLIIVDTGNNPPRAEFLPKNPLYDRTVLIAENAKIPTLVGTMKVEDNDPGVSGTVNCQSSHMGFRIQKLDQGSGFLVLLQKQLDREIEEKVNITISCADAGAPPMTAVTTFSVIVGDVNDNAPVFTQPFYIANLSENSKKDVEVIRVSAHDSDKGINSEFYYYLHPRENEMFKLNSKTGMLTSNMIFDREVNSEVKVIIKAIDEGDQAMTGTTTVVVQITDENDNAPYLEKLEFHIMEGSAPERHVGRLSAHDSDTGINAEVEYYMKAVNPLPPFTVYPDGQIRTASDVLIDREMQDTYKLEIHMIDKGIPRMSSSATVTIHVVDVNDNSPEVLFPNIKNNTVTIMWNQMPNMPFAHINATDPDDGDNAKLSFFIEGGNKKLLFDVSKDGGTVFLQRYIKDSDTNNVHRLKIEVHDNGKPHQQKTQALLNIRIDKTNATFARHEGPADLERNILIAGIVGGATIVISIVILVVIFQVKTSNRHPRRSKDPSEWLRDKTGIQEECGKTEMEKVAWKAAHADYKAAPLDPEDVEDEQVQCGPSEHVTMGKVVSLPWSNEKGGISGGDAHLSQAALDQYRKQDFYTFCKVRSPLDDVNSVTSGETTTSDSGRGGSEDDTALPPIAEVPPESGSQLCLSLDRRSDRSTSPLSPVKSGSGFGSPETKIMPLSSFREPENRRLYSNVKMSPNDASGLHPYFGDKVHPSSLRRNHYMNQPCGATAPVTSKSGSSALGSNKSLPHNRGSGRQVTFAQSKSLSRYEAGKRSPCPPAYEHLLPDGAGNYTSFSGGIDDEDGNTTTSGSYTLDAIDVDDSIS